MRRAIYIVGNWKMHNTCAEARALVREIVAGIGGARVIPPGVTMVVAPPFTALTAVREEIGEAPIELAAQNVACAEAGAHTGEVSAAMLVDVGARYAIVGHSERRHRYHEDDALVAARAGEAVHSGITPIVCVGETLEHRERGDHIAVCRRQLTAALAHIPPESVRRVLIAYEPVWAIGTGKTASPRDAEEMHRALRDLLGEISDPREAEAVSILYGGSVKPDNSAELLTQPNVDGALIGGASLSAEAFLAIMESV